MASRPRCGAPHTGKDEGGVQGWRLNRTNKHKTNTRSTGAVTPPPIRTKPSTHTLPCNVDLCHRFSHFDTKHTCVTPDTPPGCETHLGNNTPLLT